MDPVSLEVALFNLLALFFPPGIYYDFSSFSSSVESSSPSLSSITPSGTHHFPAPPGETADIRQLAVPSPNRTQGALHPTLLPHILSEKIPQLCRCRIAGTHQLVRSPFLPILSSLLRPSHHAAAFSLGRGGYPSPRCHVLVLTCPCENGAPITATEWTDFFRTKCICVRRRRERLLLRDMMGSAGCRQARGCSEELAAFTEHRCPQRRLPTRARAASRSPVTSQPPGPAPSPQPALRTPYRGPRPLFIGTRTRLR